MYIGKRNITKLLITEYDPFHICLSVKKGIAEISSCQPNIAEIDSPQVCAPEISFFQVGSAEVGPTQMCPIQNSLLQIRPTKCSTFQVGSAKDGTLQVCLTEIGPFKMHIRQMPLLRRGENPLLPRKSTIHTCQRQATQVHMPQVSTSQVQPHAFSLLLIAPVHRAPPVLVHSK